MQINISPISIRYNINGTKKLEYSNDFQSPHNNQDIHLSGYYKYADISFGILLKRRGLSRNFARYLSESGVNPKGMEAICGMKNPGAKYRFRPWTFDKVVAAYIKSPEDVVALAAIKDNKGVYWLDADDIERLVDKNTFKHFPKEVLAISEIKNSKGDYRFNGFEAASLAPVFSKNSKAVCELAKIETPVITGHTIPDLLPYWPEYSDMITSMSKELNKWGEPKYHSTEIVKAIQAAKENPGSI